MSIEQFLGGKAAWIGTLPIHLSHAVDLTTTVNWRAPASLHGRFDKVWIYEKELFSFGDPWPILVDESLRLLGQHGDLIVRTHDSQHGTLFELKSMIARRTGIDSALVYQENLADGSTVSIIKIHRLNFLEYNDNSWTIGILSNGTKSKNVFNLADKLTKLSEGRQIQILIAGPEDYASHANIEGTSDRWRDFHSDGLARIGEKKNWIVRHALNANIAIFHDRYQVDDNFFIGFDKFGTDFDFVSISQRYDSGQYFPSYVGFENRKMRWQRPIYDPSYRMLLDGHFINGGLIIIKRQIAQKINFNHLLLHNEAEDVELSFALRANGVIPRMNIYSSALTMGISDNYTATFHKISATPSPVPSKLKSFAKSIALRVWKHLPYLMRKQITKTPLHAKISRYLHSN